MNAFLAGFISAFLFLGAALFDISRAQEMGGQAALTATTSQINSDWNANSGIAKILNKPTDLSSFSDSPGYVNAAAAASAAPVQSVAGRTGAVVVVQSDVGLGNVNNTSDLNKPISTATQTALNGKCSGGGSSSQYLHADCSTGALPAMLTQAYDNGTLRTGVYPVFADVTTTSGSASINFTTNGLSGGTWLCANGLIADSLNLIVNATNISYQLQGTWSNANKTLTVSATQASSTSALLNLLGGVVTVLGAPVSAANGTVIRISFLCY